MKTKLREYIIGSLIFLSLIAVFFAALFWRYFYGPAYMFDAIQRGDFRKAALFNHLGIRPDSDIWLEGGLIHCAAATGQTQAMAKLLEMGANVNRLDGYGGTPAHAAAEFGQTNALRWLLAHGADPSITNRDGLTVAEYITNSRNDESVQVELLSILKEVSDPTNAASKTMRH